MMNLRHIASLELSKQLKNARAKIDTCYSWFVRGHYFVGTTEVQAGEPFVDRTSEYQDFPYIKICPAPNVGELMDQLPFSLDGCVLCIHREKGYMSWDVSYNTDSGNGKPIRWEQAENAADAFAKMLISIAKESSEEVHSK